MLLEMANERIEFPDALCWALERPYTIANDIPSIAIVTVYVINFLLMFSLSGTPKFVQIISSGSGAL